MRVCVILVKNSRIIIFGENSPRTTGTHKYEGVNKPPRPRFSVVQQILGSCVNANSEVTIWKTLGRLLHSE